MYSCGLAYIPAPPLLNTPETVAVSESSITIGRRWRWSLDLIFPSESLKCMWAILDFISAVGIMVISFSPSGRRICFWM